MVGRRKLPDPLLNHIFNALSIGLQSTLSFQLINFGLNCLWKMLTKVSKNRMTLNYEHCSVINQKKKKELSCKIWKNAKGPPLCCLKFSESKIFSNSRALRIFHKTFGQTISELEKSNFRKCNIALSAVRIL